MFGIFKSAATHQVPGEAPSKKFDIWMEGNPQRMDTASKVGSSYGPTFNDAVKRYILHQRGPSSTMWIFDPDARQWSFLGRKVFDNQKDAQARCG